MGPAQRAQYSLFHYNYNCVDIHPILVDSQQKLRLWFAKKKTYYIFSQFHEKIGGGKSRSLFMSVNMKAQTLIVNCEATRIPSGHSAGEHINPATRETERLTTHADTEQHGCREPQVWSELRCSGETRVRHITYKHDNTTQAYCSTSTQCKPG